MALKIFEHLYNGFVICYLILLNEEANIKKKFKAFKSL
jgi:hypothetical protein